MANLADKLRSKKVNVEEVKGWETHSRPYTFRPEGIMIHHTAGRNSLKIVRNGRSGLPGPLAQFLIAKSGKVYLISQGYCNHAGKGMSSALARVRKDQTPSGRAKSSGDMTGNKYFWGIEVENLGNGSDPYPDVQIQALVALCAALCEMNSWTPNRIIHHKEWSSRKIDMSYKGDVRRMVADVMSGKAPRGYDVDCSDVVLQRGDSGECVREVQRAIVRHGDNITIDGDYGPNTESGVKRFQTKNSLTSDGIVGPNTWKALNATSQPRTKKESSGYPVLRTGSINNYVNSLRVLLNRTGYRVAEKGTTYNSEVRDAVKEFQRDYKLTVDGITGPNTWSAIISKSEEIANRSVCEDQTFRKGDSGACVEKIQGHLKSKGIDVSIDGDFGPKTEDAVKRFQRVFRISDDGIVGPETWKTLERKFDFDKAVVYKGAFGQGLAMLIAKRWGIPALSYLDKRIVRHAVLVGQATAFNDQYVTNRMVRGSNAQEVANRVYDEIVNGDVAGV